MTEQTVPGDFVPPSDARVEEAVANTVTRFDRPGDTDPEATVRRLSHVVGPAEVTGADRFGLEFGNVLGTGGMGVVRLAQQSSLDRGVAVKSLLASMRNEDTTRLLLRESHVLGRLEHPNITPVHGLSWDEKDGPLLVMKRIEGAPWRSQLGERGGLDRLEHHLGILMTVCQALHFAHSRGVVHRDVKPANVMVGEYGEVYLVDWGVARLSTDAFDEQPGLLGSPAYAAPEMVLGDPVDARTDVFLLGACLHHVLAGTPRHPGRSIDDVLRNAARARPHVFGPDVPAELAALANRACAAAPADRPPDALAFRAELQAFLTHRSSVAVSNEARALLAGVDALIETDPLLAHRRLAAARFGFEQALREWDGNARARDGRDVCLLRLFDLEVDAQNLRAAELLAAELPADPDRNRRLDRLRSEVSQRAQLAHSLASLRRDLELGGTGWGRSLVSLVTGTLSGLYLYAGGWLVRTRQLTPDARDYALFFGLSFLITVTGLFVFRRQLLDNRMYRRLMTAFAVTPLLVAGGAYFGLRVGASFDQLVIGCIYMMTSFALILATVVSPVFWVTLADALIVAWLATSDVSHATDWAAIGWTAHAFWIAWALRPSDDLRSP